MNKESKKIRIWKWIISVLFLITTSVITYESCVPYSRSILTPIKEKTSRVISSKKGIVLPDSIKIVDLPSVINAGEVVKIHVDIYPSNTTNKDFKIGVLRKDEQQKDSLFITDKIYNIDSEVNIESYYSPTYEEVEEHTIRVTSLSLSSVYRDYKVKVKQNKDKHQREILSIKHEKPKMFDGNKNDKEFNNVFKSLKTYENNTYEVPINSQFMCYFQGVLKPVEGLDEYGNDNIEYELSKNIVSSGYGTYSIKDLNKGYIKAYVKNTDISETIYFQPIPNNNKCNEPEDIVFYSSEYKKLFKPVKNNVIKHINSTAYPIPVNKNGDFLNIPFHWTKKRVYDLDSIAFDKKSFKNKEVVQTYGHGVKLSMYLPDTYDYSFIFEDTQKRINYRLKNNIVLGTSHIEFLDHQDCLESKTMTLRLKPGDIVKIRMSNIHSKEDVLMKRYWRPEDYYSTSFKEEKDILTINAKYPGKATYYYKNVEINDLSMNNQEVLPFINVEISGNLLSCPHYRNLFIQKILGHGIGFMVEGILLTLLFYLFLKDTYPYLAFGIAFPFSFYLPFISETLQLLPYGRVSCWQDVLLDGCFYLIGWILVLIICLISRHKKKKKPIDGNTKSLENK